jgi:hypothetical protein
MGKKPLGKRTGTFTGVVQEINIAGDGPNSGQLEFSLVAREGHPMTFVAEMDTEARVVAAMTTLLTMAYRANLPVSVVYRIVDDGTSRAIQVGLPAPSQD